MRGGKRDGAGRPPGSATSRPVDWLDADQMTPLQVLLTIAGDLRTPWRLRAWAAKEAAPYIHPRLAPAGQKTERS